MKMNGFAEYLRTRNMDETEIGEHLAAARSFEAWLLEQNEQLETAGKETIKRYAEQMIKDGSNTLNNFYALCRYAYWQGFRPQYVALLEIVDCENGMETLRDAIGARHGAEIRDRIFTEPIPPVGADEPQRFAYTKKINARMNELLTPEEVRAAWFEVQHGISREEWQTHDDEQRSKYSACESLEVFLDRVRDDRNAMLTRMHDENKLWYTQEITDDALTYLIENRHMQLSEHNGRKGILVTKVPYMADKVVNEPDPKLKRYYTCHCPLIREAILRDEPISDDVCYCSLGHASHFLSGVGLENLEGEVIESAVKGDTRCRFFFYLPEEPAAS